MRKLLLTIIVAALMFGFNVSDALAKEPTPGYNTEMPMVPTLIVYRLLKAG